MVRVNFLRHVDWVWEGAGGAKKFNSSHTFLDSVESLIAVNSKLNERHCYKSIITHRPFHGVLSQAPV